MKVARKKDIADAIYWPGGTPDEWVEFCREHDLLGGKEETLHGTACVLYGGIIGGAEFLTCKRIMYCDNNGALEPRWLAVYPPDIYNAVQIYDWSPEDFRRLFVQVYVDTGKQDA